MLHPNARRRMIWDLFALTMVLIDSLVLPYEMSFYMDKAEGPLFFIGMTFFTLDIILNFRTGYVVAGLPILDPLKVARCGVCHLRHGQKLIPNGENLLFKDTFNRKTGVWMSTCPRCQYTTVAVAMH